MYVAVAWISVTVYNSLDRFGRYPSSDFASEILLGYVICFVCLLMGAIIQRVFRDPEGSNISFLAAGIAFLVFFCLAPTLARP